MIMEKNEKLKLLPIEELIKVLKKKGIKYDKSQIVAPYFPLEDVEACLDDEITADNCSPFFTLPKHLPCPVCGKPSEQLKVIKFRSPQWTWDNWYGRMGPLSICPDCGCLVEFKCLLMN